MDSPLLPAPQTPRRLIVGWLASGSGVSSPTVETDMAGSHPRMPDLSREGPFDVLQDRLDRPVPHEIVRRRKWGSGLHAPSLGS